MNKHLLLVVTLFFHLMSIKAQTITGIVTDSNGVRLSELKLQLYSMGKSLSAVSGHDGTFIFALPNDVNSNNLPTGYNISNNYPNPFNPRTRIEVTLPKASNIKIEVYNVTGQRVRDIIETNLGTGINHIDIELNGLPNGLYFARIFLDGSYSVTKKLLLLFGSQHLKIVKIPETEKISKQNKDIFIDSIVISGSYIAKTKINPPSYTAGNILNLGKIKVKKLPDPPYTPCPGIPTVNYAGKTYNTVQIGTQCWIKENLDIGEMINSQLEQGNNNIIEKYCYDNDPANCAAYGGLYQWAEAVQYQNGATNLTSPNPPFSGNVRGLCPTGWHLPNRYELFDTLSKKYNQYSYALKAVGQGILSDAGTNASGFSALMAGSRIQYNGLFYFFTENGYFWSSTEVDANYVYGMSLFFFHSYVVSEQPSKKYGYTIRCLMD